MSAEKVEFIPDFTQKLTALFKNPHLKYPILENIYEDFLSLSFLFRETKNPEYIQKMLEICLEDSTGDNQLDVFQKNYVYWQSFCLIFGNNCLDKNLDILLRKVFQKQVCAFQNMLPKKYNFITKEKRNKKLAIVITSQFLSIRHSPSNVALNTCLELIKEMNMAVSLINTAEMLSSVGEIDLCNKVTPNFIKEFNDINTFEYKDTLINFYQCKTPMPNLREIDSILSFISDLKPYFIVSVGGSSITADLCSAVAPVITYPTTLFQLPITCTQFSLLRKRKLTGADVELLQTLGKGRENVIDDVDIPGEFFESQNVYSRLQFNIPENKFIIAIAGNRLDFDISDEVFSFLMKVIKNEKIHIVIIGNFTKYNEQCAKYNDFSSRSTYLGYQDDYSGVVALCDLLINPKRQGNGHVGLLAALKGLPIVTFANNDIANLINNEEFYVNSYDEMKDIIYKYASDDLFYNDMSVKIQKIAKDYASRSYTKQIIEDIVSKSIFV